MISLNNNQVTHDTNAEAGVVSSIIQNPELLMYYEKLHAKHFYNRELASVYWAVEELYKSGVSKIDKFNLVVKLNEKSGVKKIVEDVGGDDFIDQIIENSPYVARYTIEEYRATAKRVAEFGFRRELHSTIKNFEKKCLDENNDLNSLNMEIISSLDNIAERYVTDENLTLYADRIDKILEGIEAKRKKSESGKIGMSPMWDKLEPYVRYEDQDLYLYMARRKKGKSILLLNEALDKAKNGLRVAMLSTEMSDEKDTFRILSILSGVSIDAIKSGDMSDEDRKSLDKAVRMIKNMNFTREYNTNWTRESVYVTLKAIEHKMGKLDIIVYDYIKDMDSKDSSTKYNELGLWTNFLKNDIAGGFDCPVIAAVQLNRQNFIADSDNIERFASVGIKWTEKTREEIMEDGVECGNYKMNIVFSRDGGASDDEEDYLDFYMSNAKGKGNLRVYGAQQHVEPQPDFLMDEE